MKGEKNEITPKIKNIPKSLSPGGYFLLYMQEGKAERAGTWNWDKLVSRVAEFHFWGSENIGKSHHIKEAAGDQSV